jgi:hypothetical protein
MKIKLSKSQWENMGKEAGWIKKAQTAIPISQTGPNANIADVYQQHKNQNNPNVQQPQAQQSQQPQQGQGQPNASGWTFNRLMQDPHFKQTFQTLKNQKANEKKILQYWQSMGIQYKSIPEILEVIGTDTI